MNKRQLVALWLGIAAGIAILIYPPHVAQLDHGLSGPREWTWLWSQPFRPHFVAEPDQTTEGEEIREQVRREAEAARRKAAAEIARGDPMAREVADFDKKYGQRPKPWWSNPEMLGQRAAEIKKQREDERNRQRFAGVFEHYSLDLQILGIELGIVTLVFAALLLSLRERARAG
jgi:hypothetical protein